jgi:hypothetical protein
MTYCSYCPGNLQRLRSRYRDSGRAAVPPPSGVGGLGLSCHSLRDLKASLTNAGLDIAHINIGSAVDSMGNCSRPHLWYAGSGVVDLESLSVIPAALNTF